MGLNSKQIAQLNKMNRASQNVSLGTIINNLTSGSATGVFTGSFVGDVSGSATYAVSAGTARTSSSATYSTTSTSATYSTTSTSATYATFTSGSMAYAGTSSSSTYANDFATTGTIATHVNSTGSEVHGLGNISRQSASSVGITGGSVLGASITGSFIGNLGYPVVSKTANYNLSINDCICFATGSAIITLPNASLVAHPYFVKNTGSNVVTLASVSGLIDNSATQPINSMNTIMVVSDNTNWWIL